MIIIPDVHGRPFWQKAVRDYPNETVVFLGDYLDPYDFEGISFVDALEQLRLILQLKADRGDRVVLLVGNHDLPYLFPGQFHCSRHNSQMEEPVSRLFSNFRNTLGMTYCHRTEHDVVIFSHAGILPQWVLTHNDIFGIESFPHIGSIKERLIKLIGITPDTTIPLDIARQCNELFHLEDDAFQKSLDEVSKYRWGSDFCGSIVWADVREFKNADSWPGVYQIFGHTQQESSPIINKHYACLDCRQAFRMNEETGELKQI